MATKVGNIIGNPGPAGPNGPNGPPGLPNISTDTGNTAKQGSDSKLYVPPMVTKLADTSSPGFLKQVSGNTTDIVTGQNICQDLATLEQPTIWSSRLRSYNALGNPDFAVNQKYFTGSSIFSAGTSSSWVVGSEVGDRWAFNWSTTNAFMLDYNFVAYKTGPYLIPGTTYALNNYYEFKTHQPATTGLAAGDYLNLQQAVEGSSLRELVDDVHSLSLLVYSTYVPFTFSVRLRNTQPSPNVYSLVKTYTITQANTWTLVQFPNLQNWNAVGQFNITPGTIGYYMSVVVGAGSNWVAPQTGVWVNGDYLVGPGQTDISLIPNAPHYFRIGYVQHEPGPVCTSFMPPYFSDNLLACQRYWAKGNAYGANCPTSGDWRRIGQFVTTTYGRMDVMFPVEFYVKPTLVLYDNTTTQGNVYVDNVGSTAFSSVVWTKRAITSINFASLAGNSCSILGQWRAYTGL